MSTRCLVSSVFSDFCGGNAQYGRNRQGQTPEKVPLQHGTADWLTKERECFMATKDRDTAVGVFTDFTHAEQAIHELRRCGFASDRIGFIADDPEKIEAPRMEPGTQ